ncbi:protection of telomeres protein 1-like [Protopterus annectens]|uniref:protection of telomeres protein 1-like n=1 Tax=Protopterus annectens TaxID=7888 RepID=UPI001CF98BA3|nr:protection of telomeres protein 1-like [Protopterus annectens]
MAVRLLKEVNGAPDAQIGTHLRRAYLNELTLDFDCTDKYIQGTILLKYPPSKLGTGQSILKLVLQAHATDQSATAAATINTFIFGKLVEMCTDTIHQGDSVIFVGFTVDKSPTAEKDGRHRCQLELSEEVGTMIYVYGKSSSVEGVAEQITESRSTAVRQKYTYTPLNQLKSGSIVNVYGVVKFFKPPYRTKGTGMYCFLVWDGTKCSYPSWRVFVEGSALEGDEAFIHKLCNLTVDILVYDNHTLETKCLKPGMFLRIYNLHAKCGLRTPADVQCLEFYLHGGNSYGRGIRVLPDESYDVTELKKHLDSVDLQQYQDLEGISLLEWDNTLTGPLSQDKVCLNVLDRCQQESATVVTSHHHLNSVPLSTVVKEKAPQKYRIRAKMKSYEPQKLYQSIKLYCPRCHALQDIPSDEDLETALKKSMDGRHSTDFHNSSWYWTASWNTEQPDHREIVIHFVKREEIQENSGKTLILIERVNLVELRRLSEKFGGIIPVKSCDQLSLGDLCIPFFIQGRHWHYGCRNCSILQNVNHIPSLNQEELLEPSAIAGVLGIQPLQYAFLMKFTLEDESAVLEAYLWDEAEKFLRMPASDVIADHALQEKLQTLMRMLSPPGRNIEDRPWLECCIKSYCIEEGGNRRVCYQVFDTIIAEDDC